MNHFLHYQDDSLHFGEKSIRLADLAAKAEGPTYVYDLDLVESRYKAMRDAVRGSHLFFALKANPHRDLLGRLAKAGAGADVVSGGEIRRALECGFEASKIIYSGVGKTDREIRFAIENEIWQLNVESVPELVRIGEISRASGKKARVAFRLNPDVDIKTHPYIATGLAENKFGMEFSKLSELESVLDANKEALELVGVSLHLGSQMREFDGLGEGLRRLRPIYERLRSRYQTVRRFDAGGGLGVHYEHDRPDLEAQDLQNYARVIATALEGVPGELQLEPGRWIVAHAGVLLTKVLYVKTTSTRTFLIVDSGMNHLLRPALYQAKHRVLPILKSHRPMRKYDVAGPICESSDFFAKGIELSEVSAGEWLAIADAGAYGASMASSYNLQDLPSELAF